MRGGGVGKIIGACFVADAASICRPGCAPGSAPSFFCVAKAKKAKERRPHWPCPFAALRAACDARARGGAAELAARCALRSDNRSKSVHEAWACCAAHARPTPCASRHGQRGVQLQPGPSLRSAPVLAFARAERSDDPCGFPTPLRLRLRRRACGVARAPQDARASWTDSRGLFERRERSERSEFHRAPRKRCDAGWPRSEAQGSQTWGSLSLVPFFGEAKKGTAPPGAYPGQQVLAAPAKHQTTVAKSNAQPLTPALSPKGRGSRAGHTSRPVDASRIAAAPHAHPLCVHRGEGARPYP